MYLVYSTIAVFLIGIFISYVYFKKSKYGLILLFITLFLTSFAVYWNLSETSRQTKLLQKITLEELTIIDPSLTVAYGNKYLYKAQLINKSLNYKLNAIELKLDLTGKNNESIQKWIDVWIAPNSSKQINAYFPSKYIAKKTKPENWKVNIIASKAKK